MKTLLIKEKFIDLRVQGLSYEKIAKRLGVCKQTLINWNSEMSMEISNLRACRLEEIYEKYCISKEKRVELFGKALQSIVDELGKRSLSDVPTTKLFTLLTHYAEQLKNEAKFCSPMDNDEIEDQRSIKEMLRGLKNY